MSTPTYTYFGYDAIGQARGVQLKGQNIGLFGQYQANLQGGTGSGPGGGIYEPLDGMWGEVCTGAAWGPSDISNAAGTTALVSAVNCPSGMRPYVVGGSITNLGPVNWSNTSPTSIPFLSLQDTTGTPLWQIPFNALRGGATLSFGEGIAMDAPLIVGPAATATPFGAAGVTTVASYAAGVLTLTGDPFAGLTSETQIVGTPVKILSGTGAGQTAYITACAAGALTLNVNWGTATGTVAPDTTTSVIAIYWQAVGTYTDTTHITLYNASGTPYTAQTLDSFTMQVIQGLGSYEARPIIAQTTAGACTLGGALSAATNATTGILSISTNPQNFGAVDLTGGGKQAVARLNTGLQAVVNVGAGTSPLGSAVRVYLRYRWAA